MVTEKLRTRSRTTHGHGLGHGQVTIASRRVKHSLNRSSMDIGLFAAIADSESSDNSYVRIHNCVDSVVPLSSDESLISHFRMKNHHWRFMHTPVRSIS
jgi:hypothetical protein